MKNNQEFLLECEGDLSSIHSTVTCIDGTIFGENGEPVKSVLCGSGKN